MVKARASAGLLLLAAALALGGCAGLPQAEALRVARDSLPPRAELADVPFFPQEEHQCGPAALATILTASGIEVTPAALADQVYLPSRQGSLQVEMLAAARRHGRIAYELAPSLPGVLAEVAAGNPVVVLQNVGIRMMPFWHYAVVVGYDIDAGEIILRSGATARKRLPVTAFDFFWRDGGYWAMVAMPPGRLPATAAEDRYGAAVAAVEHIGRVDDAGQAYAAMLARWPESFIALMGLGNTRHARGRLGEAEAAFRSATVVRPDAAAAFNNLAQTLADQGRLQEALAPARKAVEIGGPLLAASRATLAAVESGIAARPVPAARDEPPADAQKKQGAEPVTGIPRLRRRALRIAW
jgi:hypothetical protein